MLIADKDIILKFLSYFKEHDLKSSLKYIHKGNKVFMNLLKDYPELQKEYNMLVQRKKEESCKGASLKEFSEETINNIIQDYESGISLQKLEKKYKTSQVVIKRHFKKYGVTLRNKEDINNANSIKMCPIKTDEQWLEVYKDYKRERTLIDIIKKYHTSEEVIKKNFKRLNLPLLGRCISNLEYLTNDGKKKLKDESYWKEIYSFYKKNPISKVEEKVGITRRRIYGIFKFYGWKQRTRLEEAKFRSIEREPSNNIKRILENNPEYTLLDKYRGISVNGNWIKYRIKHERCGRIFKRTLHSLEEVKCVHCYPDSENESRLRTFVEKYADCIKGDRKLIAPQELDIYIPSKGIAIEYNGSFWHSSANVSSNYHKEKTIRCLEKGIKLYHFWDYQNINIIESKVKQLLGKGKKLFARKLQVTKVSTKERKLFFSENHLSGDVSASIALGLKNKGTLVACISFRKHKEGIEIARYACLSGFIIVGGFSRLLSHSCNLLKELYPKCKKLISYCDRDITPDYKDSVYFKNGFTFKGDTGKILKYFEYKKNNVVSREKYQKKKLKKYFKDYEENKNVKKFLFDKSIYELYNSGNWKFEKEF